MTRYWTVGPHSLGTSNDDVDLTIHDPAAVEVTFEEWQDAAAAISAAVPPPQAPVTTPLFGNGLVHLTDPTAKRVTVQIVAPTGGPTRARPTIDGSPVSGSAGPLVYDRPGHPIRIETRAGNNDVMIVEEF